MLWKFIDGVIRSLFLFAVRITGKEEMVDLVQDEAEVFKEKNYHHKERVGGYRN